MLFLYIYFAFIGACLGSFSSVLISRIPKGQKWYGFERSACTSCGATLQIVDLVPVFSWAFLKGRCRKCRAKLSWLYPLLEILCAFLAVFGVIILGLGIWLLLWLITIPVLVSFGAIWLMSIKKKF